MERRSLGGGSRLGARPAPPPRPAPAARPVPTTPYHADGWALALPPGWSDATTHTIAGPVADGLAHTVTVTSAPSDGRSVEALADVQVRAVLDALPGAVVLLRDTVALAGGAGAVRAVVRWSPTSDRVLYQQQVYAVVGGRSVVLAASFTARSRRLLGDEVHRLMLSLAEPDPPDRRRGGAVHPRLGR